MNEVNRAKQLLQEFKGTAYVYGPEILQFLGSNVALLGKRAALVRDTFPGSDDFVSVIRRSLESAGVDLVAEIPGAGPNCPREDLFRITDAVRRADPAVTVSFGGGSTIDAVKAALALTALGGEIDDYFGTGEVTKRLGDSRTALIPHVAIQSAASSGAHLTKYSNITDVSTGQKKLIVDEAIVPPLPVFDYSTTYGAPKDLTMDGALDGISHSLEVLYGAVGKDHYDRAEDVAATGISLIVENLPQAIDNPQDTNARDALCLGTDLGGYSIMVGGTNGGHLTSFSLVDVLSHGRACALMNPYYTVFFAPAIEKPLRVVGNVYRKAGFSSADFDALSGAELGRAVAEAMFALSDRIGFPKTLGEVDGFSSDHIARALAAAKNPQLAMKLQNMPVPLTADMIDEYMLPILKAAADGDLGRIKAVS